MNFRLLAKLLGLITLLIGGAMVFSMPWAFPALGYRKDGPATMGFEWRGFLGLFGSVVVCGVVGGLLLRYGRRDKGQIYRKEAMAVVGLSWVMATVFGGLPFYLTGVGRGPAVRLFGDDHGPQIARWGIRENWREMPLVDRETYRVLRELLDASSVGLSPQDLIDATENPQSGDVIKRLAESDPHWDAVIVLPGSESVAADRDGNYRIRFARMTLIDCLFESQSGFSTTGATVISELEDPILVPHCILFWRSFSHFLGGLGIIVLFVVILGQGSVGKALMRTEMPGPSKEGSTARMQHTAWRVAGMYLGLNAVLAVILWTQNMSLFDSLCHTFGTMATGGFSTYNASLGHFDSAVVDYVVIVFMILAGSNFTLLFLSITKSPTTILKDVEWRVYMGIIVTATILIVWYGLADRNFDNASDAVRYGLFQTVSIMTTTGYGTRDFDNWAHLSRGLLFMLMFVGGCAGSTGGGMKVIRHVLFVKILRLEVEHSFHPSVVRPLRLGGQSVDDNDLRKNILIYFGLITLIFVVSFFAMLIVEPDRTWGNSLDNKLVDSASAVAATLNNIGPGLGTVGATQNYGHFSGCSKLLFVWLMMLGRLELFSVLALLYWGLWHDR